MFDHQKIISLALPGEDENKHNKYIPGYGYVTDHIPANQQRGDATHWDEQYQESESFEDSWKPRPGPLEFVYNLSKQHPDGLTILNMGAGLGDFSVDLAMIPGVKVYHIDFSERGNTIAKQKVSAKDLGKSITVITGDNNQFLEKFVCDGNYADIVFLYGASGSNEPRNSEYQKTFELSVGALRPGGYLWYVHMVQPRLIDSSDIRIVDVLGDFPKPPHMAGEILKNNGMCLIKEELHERPDYHPLVPGGLPIHHVHLAERGLYRKEDGDQLDPAPDFHFIESVDPNWNTIWNELNS